MWAPEGFVAADLANRKLTLTQPAEHIRTGRIAHVRGDTKLGRDQRGRLYASRYLNPAAPVEEDASDDLSIPGGSS